MWRDKLIIEFGKVSFHGTKCAQIIWLEDMFLIKRFQVIFWSCHAIAYR